jgi:glycosyltransferase involved in cell wall biosynthesis
VKRIVLNAQLLSFSASYRQAGISRLIHATIQGLQTVDQQNTYVVFTGDRNIPAGYITNERWRIVVPRLPAGRRPLRILWEQAALPWSLLAEQADLLHALAFVGPLVCPRPQVVTVYDLSFLLYPAVFNRLNRLYLSTMTPISVRRARRVIAISESTKRDLVRLMHVPAEHVDVVYPALEPGIQRVEDGQSLAAFRRRHNLPERFILFVGTLEPRKNVAALVQAYSLLRRRGMSQALVLAGSKGWRYEEIFAAIEASGVAQDIILPGYVAREELPLWYSAADAFVYPSLYEGFGLPVLEAMACGAPVITSNVSSLPEVAGDAALLVDPADIGGLADAIQHVVSSSAVRSDMQARGMQRAATFTLDRMARATCAVYSRALSSIPSPVAPQQGRN